MSSTAKSSTENFALLGYTFPGKFWAQNLIISKPNRYEFTLEISSQSVHKLSTYPAQAKQTERLHYRSTHCRG